MPLEIHKCEFPVGREPRAVQGPGKDVAQEFPTVLYFTQKKEKTYVQPDDADEMVDYHADVSIEIGRENCQSLQSQLLLGGPNNFL